MALSLKSSVAAVAAFIRQIGSSAAPAAGEGILGAHLEDLNGKPLALSNGQALNATQFGVPFMAQNDNNALMVRADRFGGLASAMTQPLLAWFVEGTTLNSRVFNPLATTMASAQTAQGLTLNSGAITTVNTNYQLNTFKVLPLLVKAPLLMRIRARISQWGIANTTAEYGLANSSATLGQTANLNGVYWRLDSAGVMPVMAINGAVAVLGTDVSGLLNAANFYIWDVIKDDDQFVFTVQNSTTGAVISRQVLQVPAGAQKAILASHAQPYIRVFNAASAPATATQVLVSEWTAGLLDTNLNMSPSQLATNLGLGSEQGPTTYTTTSSIANSTVAATTVPTNTTATAPFLDGPIRIAAPAGSTTDLALFSYTVPAPYQYRCKRVLLSVKNLGAAVATTPTQIDFFLCVNGSGVTLVGNLSRKYIGTQTFPVGAAIGACATELPISLDLSEADLITEAGRVISLVARCSTGTATASQVLEIMYTNLGHFE